MLRSIPNTQVVIVPDVRRKYELRALKTYCTTENMRFVTVRINVPQWVREKRGWSRTNLDSNIS